MPNKISFEIQALESDSKTPISEATIELENINIKQTSTTDSSGLALFEIDEKEYPKPLVARL